MDEIKRRAHELFMEALDLDEDTQADFLTRSCADDASLRKEVEHLLAAVKASTDFLGQPVLESSLGPSPQIDAGAIQGYEITQRVGSGGMADVYEARQASPQRKVAIKILRRALRGTSMVQRFRFEADILAKLNHPGIAKIFETGVCEDGLGEQVPYLVMEFVEDAVTIAQFVKQQNLSVSERLVLFTDVCDAVQYGHQMGVIHRDLKPGNLLIDREGRVRVIDFGVAKVTGPDRERLTISQERGSLIGTLEYMSPEQCSGEDTVGTASDVYSLGVVLYELVTETRPYDFSSTSLLGAVQRVQLKVPDRPSERKASVSKELNAVVLKAMEKEPTRRYASAAEFADDVRRYLHDRPVLARPASSWYHLRLFAKRNKALVAALAGILLALVAGILGTARMARVASLARDEAIANERVSEQIADFQGERIRRINVQAMGQQTQKELLSAVRKSLEDDPQVGPKQVEERMREFRRLLERVNFTTITLNTLHDNVLAKAEASINAQFVDQPLVRARLLQSLARTNFEHGLLASALQPLQEATRLRVEHLGEDDQETLLSRLALAELLSALGRRDESLEIVQDVVDRRIALLGDDDPLTMRAKSQLGGVLNKLGRVDEAEAIWAETLERRRELLGPNHESTLVSLNNMGLIHAVKGDYEKAETVWRELVERRREKFGPNHRTYRASLSNLGLLLVDLGKLKEARAFLEESLESARAEMGDDHPETLRTMSGVAALRSQLGDLEGARELLRENYEGRLQVLGVDHQDTLRALVALGDAESRCGDLPLAEQRLREAIEAQEDLLGSDHADLIISNAALARVLFKSDQLDEAEQVMQRALDLASDSPRPLQAVMGQTLGEFGRRLLDLGQPEQAEPKLLQAHEILAAELGDSEPVTQQVAQSLVELYSAQATDPEQDERVQRWQRAAAGVAAEEERTEEE